MTDKQNVNYKWIVIGVLGLGFFLIFREDISAMLGRTESVRIDSAGITLKTVATPIGSITVSDKVSEQTAGISSGAAPDYAGSDWEINWPADRWQSIPSVAESVGAELYIGFHRSFGQFNPNINVIRQPAQGMSARQYAQFSIDEARQKFSAHILVHEIDEETQSGVLAYELSGLGTAHVARFFIRNGTVYLATATQLKSLEEPRLWSEMRMILNSFRPA